MAGGSSRPGGLRWMLWWTNRPLDGLQALRGARAQIQLQLTLGGLTQDEQALTEDLLARVEEAMNPYFDA